MENESEENRNEDDETDLSELPKEEIENLEELSKINEEEEARFEDVTDQEIVEQVLIQLKQFLFNQLY